MNFGVRIVDLSVVLDGNTQVYPGDPQPRFSIATRVESEGYNLLGVEIGSQSGTHVDSPYHFLDDGLRLEDCDPALFVGPGVFVDARHLRARERITWELVARYEQQLRPGVIAVFHTGWSEKHYGSDEYFEHPFLDGDACGRMLEAGVATFAIDAINLDETVLDEREPDFTCHLQIAGAGGIISENLTNLSAVDFDDPVISLLPIRFGGDADGAPCRAVAMQLGDGP
ncbi:MAG: cyclase family protein [Actinomycetota bacterium]